jgi:hypothetical protein
MEGAQYNEHYVAQYIQQDLLGTHGYVMRSMSCTKDYPGDCSKWILFDHEYNVRYAMHTQNLQHPDGAWEDAEWAGNPGLSPPPFAVCEGSSPVPVPNPPNPPPPEDQEDNPFAAALAGFRNTLDAGAANGAAEEGLIRQISDKVDALTEALVQTHCATHLPGMCTSTGMPDQRVAYVPARGDGFRPAGLPENGMCMAPPSSDEDGHDNEHDHEDDHHEVSENRETAYARLSDHRGTFAMKWCTDDGTPMYSGDCVGCGSDMGHGENCMSDGSSCGHHEPQVGCSTATWKADEGAMSFKMECHAGVPYSYHYATPDCDPANLLLTESKAWCWTDAASPPIQCPDVYQQHDGLLDEVSYSWYLGTHTN